MQVKDKKIIVFGLGITGKSVVKALSNLGAKVYIYDDRPYEKLKNDVFSISNYNFELIHEDVDIDWDEISLLIKSPGIRLDNEFIELALKNNIEVISEIELAYRIYGGDNFISITGTNGKTTVTSLIGHILKSAGKKVKIVGNIGVGLLSEMEKSDEDTLYVLELSSFQLASTKEFRSKISVITNISPDHLDWHGNFKEYFNSKLNIMKNMIDTDLLIVNKDDSHLTNLNANRIEFFSIKEKADAYLDNENLVSQNFIYNKNNMKLVGRHNISNVLAAILVAKELDISSEEISKALDTFKPIKHRLEFISDINGVKYYNDSKGTNVDSTKVALESFDKNIILIAGGYDKGVSFDGLFNNPDKIKELILIGQTAKQIQDTAFKFGIKNINIVKDMTEAVELAYKNARRNDIVLLSPACASWDMYENYEIRGDDFRNLVKSYE